MPEVRQWLALAGARLILTCALTCGPKEQACELGGHCGSRIERYKLRDVCGCVHAPHSGPLVASLPVCRSRGANTPLGSNQLLLPSPEGWLPACQFTLGAGWPGSLRRQSLSMACQPVEVGSWGLSQFTSCSLHQSGRREGDRLPPMPKVWPLGQPQANVC